MKDEKILNFKIEALSAHFSSIERKERLIYLSSLEVKESITPKPKEKKAKA